MPQLSGFEVLRLIRANTVLAKTPVLILTASTDDEEKMQAIGLGATDFLHKPIHSSELLTRLRNILKATTAEDQWQDYAKTLEATLRQKTDELEATRRLLNDCLARTPGPPQGP